MLDRGVVGGRVRLLLAAELWREVEHVHEQPRALDMGEEVVAEPGAFACALDQAWDVGDHELALARLRARRATGESVVNG